MTNSALLSPILDASRMTMRFACSAALFVLAVFAATSFAESTTAPQPQASSSTAFQLIVAPQTVRSDEVTLVWDKPEEAGPDTTYQVLCDDKPVGSGPNTHFTVKNLEPEHEYAFVVKTQTASGSSRSTNSLQVKTMAKEQTVSVVDYGAKGDGKTINTKAIQAAIDACPAHGIVSIPAGVFLSGALFLKSDMTLSIAAGAMLKGSTALSDYEPLIHNRFEGLELDTYASLLNAGTLDHTGAFNVRNLSIRGEGTISGGGAPLAKAMIAAKGVRGRGRLLCLMNCSGLEIQGVTLEESPCWTLHYLYCENVSCHDLTINSTIRNGDGLDPDSSRNSYIFNCSFSTGDDCIAIKSGKNPEGNVINRPTENVRIINCKFTKGHGISIGSETSGGIRNVLVQDCIAGNLKNGFQIKATKDRGNIIDGVVVRDCQLQKVTILTSLTYNNDGEPAPDQPYFRNFRFLNLDMSGADRSSVVMIIKGFSEPGHRTKNVTFENVKLPTGAIIKVDQTEDVKFTHVLTTDGKKPTYQITKSERVAY